MDFSVFTAFSGVVAVLAAVSILTVASMSVTHTIAAKAFEQVQNTQSAPSSRSGRFYFAYEKNEAQQLRDRIDRFTSSLPALYALCLVGFLLPFVMLYAFGNSFSLSHDNMFLQLGDVPRAIRDLIGGYSIPAMIGGFIIGHCVYAVFYVILLTKHATTALRLRDN